MGHTSTSPFMNIRDETERKVSFNARDELGDKLDKLTVMISKLAVKDSNSKKPFKPQIYKCRSSYPQNRNNDQRNYQNRGRLGNRSDSRNRGQYGNDRHRFQQSYTDNNFQENTRDIEDKIAKENIGITRVMATIEVGTDWEKGHSQEIMVIIGIEVQAIVDQSQDLELTLIETE